MVQVSPPGRYVAVVGPGEAEATPALTALATEIGAGIVEELAAVVVCGGLGGVMAAAARGARSAGGLSVGILPGLDHADADEQLTLAIATGLGELRDGLVVRASQAVIAIGGSWGTTVEIAFAVKLSRPVVCLRGWRFLDGDGLEAAGVEHAHTVGQALRWVRDELRWTPGA